MPLNYVNICKALYVYTAQTDDELSFHEDDVLYILENDDEDWWKAKLKIANAEGAETSEEHSIGLVPRNYIQEEECTAVLKALWNYEANSEEELSFKEDDMLNLYDEDGDGWYLVKFNGVFGMIPPNYVEKVSVDSVEQDAQEENDVDEENSESQTNKAKPVSLFDALSSASDQNNTYVDPLKLYAVKAARPKAGSSANENKDWSVTELVGDKKKQKKKGTLVIGSGRVIFASESDKAPVRQWEINDIIEIKKDKKNISFTFGGSKGGTIDFHANKNIITEIYQKSEDCRASLEIPTVKVDNASIRSNITSPSTPTSSRPSSTHKSIESEEPQYEEDEQYEEQNSRSNSHHNVPEEEEEEEEIEPPSPKFGVALYDFEAQGDDEVSIREGDELWVIDYVSSEEWWKVKKDDEEGVVPASFIELRNEEDNEAEKAAQAAAQAASEAAAAEAERQRLEEEERIKYEEERRRRQHEEERKRREAEKRAQEEKKRKTAAQSPPPPPVLSNRPVRANPSIEEEAVKKIQTPANRALPERPAHAQSKSKPIPSNTRSWTDRTGSFKVEAQFLQLVDGKVHLHKLNGVKIAVPVDKMSKEDLAYLEEITGEKVFDKNDNTPLAAIAAAYKGKARLSNNHTINYDWYDFFLNADVSHEDAFEYAKNFLAEKMDESSISELNRDVMKGLGIKEGDIIRIKKYIDQKYSSGKKRNVSFGSTSVIPDDIDRQPRNKQSARKTQSEDAKKAHLSEFDIKMQMKRDEQFARELQEEENRIARSEGRQIPKAADLYGNLDSIIQKEEKKTPPTTPPQLFSANNGVLKNNTKKARPQPTKAASIQIDAKSLVNAKDSLDDAFKSSSSTTSTENKFDDNAWVSKDLTPPLVPTVKAQTPPPPPPPPPSIPQPPPSIPVLPSNLSSTSNSSVNQNQPPVSSLRNQFTSPSPGPNTTEQFSVNSWNAVPSSNSNNMNVINVQSSQPTPPPIPPPPPQQSIVVPLNNALHPPLIPVKSFPSSTSNTNNNMNTVNNTQGNNMLSAMNLQRSNSANSFQGMGTGNLSGPGNFNPSMNTWSSPTSLTSNSTSGYNLSNQFNQPRPQSFNNNNNLINPSFNQQSSNQLQQFQLQQTTSNQIQQFQVQQTTNQLQQLQLQSSSPNQLKSQQSSKYDPQNVFASMKAGQFGPIAPTNNLGANASQDRYSVFKQVDPNAPSVFSQQNSSMNTSSFGQPQSGFANSNPANWNQSNFNRMSTPQQTSNFGVSGTQQNPGFGFGGQPSQMGLNPQGFNPNQGLNNNSGFNNQGFNTNPGFNNNNKQQNPGGFNRQW